ncbi:MAG TPA: sugar transferase, partial [Caulobacteraceae bacterium]|nr:sugar transferase [Caulobacteraceae bacterium]
MLMMSLSDIAGTRAQDCGESRGRVAGFIIAAAAVTVIAVWTAISIAIVINNVGLMVVSSAFELHILLNLGCTALATYYVTRIRGPLDHRFSQGLLATALTFGIYALAIISLRLFYSRLMLTSAVLQTAFVTAQTAWLGRRLLPNRVAVIAPLVGEGRFSESLGQVIRDPNTDLRGFDIVLVSLTKAVNANWAKALSRAMLAGCKVVHIGQYVEDLRGAVPIEHFEVEHLPPNGIASYSTVKRLLDIGLVVFILPACLPLIALGALAVWISGGGSPILFSQQRVGVGGTQFRLWKLRTMRPECAAEPIRAAVVRDDRITKVGRVLRRFRVDELPQLWNVLKGDMSLIGPRPEAVVLHSEYSRRIPNYAFRYLVRPGITGWAQV